MRAFDYTAIFIGIVVALAIENVAMSTHRLLSAGSRVRWHWMAPLTAVNASLTTLGGFWLLWNARDSIGADRTFLMWLPLAVNFIILFLSAAATLPDDVPDAGLDLKVFYFANHRYWILVAVYFLCVSTENAVAMAWPGYGFIAVRPDPWFLLANVIAVAGAVSLVYIRAAWWNGGWIVLSTILLLVFLGPLRVG